MAVWPRQIPLIPAMPAARAKFHAGNLAKIVALGTRIRPIPAYITGRCDDEQERGTGIERGEIDDRAIDPFAAG
jgi:hypothetical protein